MLFKKDQQCLTKVKGEAEHGKSLNCLYRIAVGNCKKTSASKNLAVHQESVSVNFGKTEIKKLTAEEEDNCMRDGHCLPCRPMSRLSKNCAIEKK